MVMEAMAGKDEARGYQVLYDYFNGGPESSAGIVVNSQSALGVPAVYACVRVLAETLAQLPLIVYERLKDGGKERASGNTLYRTLHDQPNSWQTSADFRDQMMTYALLSGNAIAEIKVFSRDVELWPLHPSRVTIQRNTNGSLVYLVTDEVGSPQRVLLQGEVFHVRGPSIDGVVGLTPISYAKNTIGATIAGIEHGATTWKNGARPGIVLQTDQTLPPNAAQRMRQDWERLYGGSKNAGKTAVLEAGLKVHEIAMTHQDMQFIEQQRMNVEDIARLFRVPLHMIGDLTHATFSNIEHQQLAFVSHTMGPWFARWEQAIQRDLIQDDRYFAEFLAEGLLRGDVAARTSHYREMFNIGVYSVDEIRAKENLNPIGEEFGGGKRFVNAAMIELSLAGQPPNQDPANDPTPDQQQAARSLWDAERKKLRRWTADEMVRQAQTPEKFIDRMESFLVNHEAREEVGLRNAERVCRVCGVDVSAKDEAQENRSHVMQQVLKLSECQPQELAAKVELFAEEWRK